MFWQALQVVVVCSFGTGLITGCVFFVLSLKLCRFWSCGFARLLWLGNCCEVFGLASLIACYSLVVCCLQFYCGLDKLCGLSKLVSFVMCYV